MGHTWRRFLRGHGTVIGLLVALALLAAWRIACVRAGPDVDSDAYGHHAIARQILSDPRDLAVHWVWLPLFHYVQAALVACGGTMQTVRYANVAVTAATPLLLFAYLRWKGRDGLEGKPAAEGEVVALIAALLAALSPIAMQMGTTAQPEPLFCLLVLSFIFAFDAGRYRLAAVLLSAAALLRYEAWAVPPMLAAWLLFERWRLRGSGGRTRSTDMWLPVVVPVLAIAAWAALRRPVDGAWFGFLAQTREFANDANKARSSFDGGIAGVARDLVYYPVVVPWRTMGPLLLLAPLGAPRTVRQTGAVFCVTYIACLGFLTLSWIMRSSLGLDRHFVAVVPAYATMAANGIAEIASRARSLASRLFGHGERAPRIAGEATLALLGACALVGALSRLGEWMRDWRASIEHGWPDRLAVGAYLRSLPGSSTIFCDESTVEILSGLDRRRFDRHWVDDPTEPERVRSAAQREGAVYVATWMRKLKTLRGEGEIVYRPPGEEDEAKGLGVLRFVRR